MYDLRAKVRQQGLMITGKLPSRFLRDQAEEIAQTTLPDYTLESEIIVVDTVLDAEVQRTVEVLNQVYGTNLATEYTAGQLTVRGPVYREADLENVTTALQGIPGIETVISDLLVQPRAAATRVYFEPDSSVVIANDIDEKLVPIKQFMREKPDLNLKIIGYRHPSEENGSLALERAQAVTLVLEDLGIDRRRLQAQGGSNRPPDIDSNQPEWLSRAVLFELF